MRCFVFLLSLLLASTAEGGDRDHDNRRRIEGAFEANHSLHYLLPFEEWLSYSDEHRRGLKTLSDLTPHRLQPDMLKLSSEQIKNLLELGKKDAAGLKTLLQTPRSEWHDVLETIELSSLKQACPNTPTPPEGPEVNNLHSRLLVNHAWCQRNANRQLSSEQQKMNGKEVLADSIAYSPELYAFLSRWREATSPVDEAARALLSHQSLTGWAVSKKALTPLAFEELLRERKMSPEQLEAEVAKDPSIASSALASAEKRVRMRAARLHIEGLLAEGVDPRSRIGDFYSLLGAQEPQSIGASVDTLVGRLMENAKADREAAKKVFECVKAQVAPSPPSERYHAQARSIQLLQIAQRKNNHERSLKIRALVYAKMNAASDLQLRKDVLEGYERDRQTDVKNRNIRDIDVAYVKQLIKEATEVLERDTAKLQETAKSAEAVVQRELEEMRKARELLVSIGREDRSASLRKQDDCAKGEGSQAKEMVGAYRQALEDIQLLAESWNQSHDGQTSDLSLPHNERLIQMAVQRLEPFMDHAAAKSHLETAIGEARARNQENNEKWRQLWPKVPAFHTWDDAHREGLRRAASLTGPARDLAVSDLSASASAVQMAKYGLRGIEVESVKMDFYDCLQRSLELGGSLVPADSLTALVPYLPHVIYPPDRLKDVARGAPSMWAAELPPKDDDPETIPRRTRVTIGESSISASPESKNEKAVCLIAFYDDKSLPPFTSSLRKMYETGASHYHKVGNTWEQTRSSPQTMNTRVMIRNYMRETAEAEKEMYHPHLTIYADTLLYRQYLEKLRRASGPQIGQDFRAPFAEGEWERMQTQLKWRKARYIRDWDSLFPILYDTFGPEGVAWEVLNAVGGPAAGKTWVVRGQFAANHRAQLANQIAEHAQSHRPSRNLADLEVQFGKERAQRLSMMRKLFPGELLPKGSTAKAFEPIKEQWGEALQRGTNSQAPVANLFLPRASKNTGEQPRSKGTGTSQTATLVASAVRAESMLGRTLTSTQAEAVESAHLAGNTQALGKDGVRPPGIGNYTQGQLRDKVSILRNAGFNRQDVRRLIEGGVVGRELEDAMAWEAALGRLPKIPHGPRTGLLHQNVTNGQRIQAIREVPLVDIMSAPGHNYLRSPTAVMEMSRIIQSTNGAGDAEWAKTPAVLNVTTRVEKGAVRVISVELFDGNHRIAAGIHSGRWKTIGDIPAPFLEVRVNGQLAGGAGAPPRWIPKEVAERSGITGWQDVSGSPLARGPTAQIPANISSFDPRFAPQDQGVRLGEVLETTLQRLKSD